MLLHFEIVVHIVLVGWLSVVANWLLCYMILMHLVCNIWLKERQRSAAAATVAFAHDSISRESQIIIWYWSIGCDMNSTCTTNQPTALDKNVLRTG